MIPRGGRQGTAEEVTASHRGLSPVRNGRLASLRSLVLTTHRKSGEPYHVQLWFVYREGKILIVSSLGLEAWWTRHILRDPRVEAQLGRGRVVYQVEGLAAVVPGPRLLQEVASLVYHKYYGWDNPEAVKEWCSRAVLVEIIPTTIERLARDATTEEVPLGGLATA